jgi:hypothetical protein
VSTSVTMKFLLFKKHEQSECIIAFDFFKLIYVLTKKLSLESSESEIQ